MQHRHGCTLIDYCFSAVLLDVCCYFLYDSAFCTVIVFTTDCCLVWYMHHNIPYSCTAIGNIFPVACHTFHSPMGSLLLIFTGITFLTHVGHAFPSRQRVFSGTLGCCGERRGGACTLQRKLGPRLGSVARALGVQSRGELTLFAGPFRAEPEPSRALETHTKLYHGRTSYVLLCI